MDLTSTYIVTCNFIPSEAHLNEDISYLQLWIGDRVKIIAAHGAWCYGHVIDRPNKNGLFPSEYVKEIRKFSNTKTLNDARQIIAEITEALKVWWCCIKERYGHFDGDICEKSLKYIQDLMIIRNKLCSGNVPTEELKEIREHISRKIDLGNHLLGLNMHIRNESGKLVRAEELSVVSAFKQHEATFLKFGNEISENDSAKDYLFLIFPNQSIDIKSSSDLEFCLNLLNLKSGEIISETLTLNWSFAEKRFLHDSCKALFIDISEKEFKKDGVVIKISVLKFAPIDGRHSIGRKNIDAALTSRQLYAEGHVNLYEAMRNTAEKRDILFNLVRSRAEGNSSLANPKSPFHRSLPSSTTDSDPMTFDYKIPITFTVQLFNGTLERIQERSPDIFLLNPSMAIVQKIHPASGKSLHGLRRNEAYVYLGSSDFHSNKSSLSSTTERSIEAMLAVYDGEGNRLPDCFEIITPDKVVYQTVHRSRVYVRDERPNFNEIVKIVLPSHAVKNLHLRILYYNRKFNNLCSGGVDTLKKRDASDKGPVGLSFVHLIRNFALVGDSKLSTSEEWAASNMDELLVYKIDSGKFNERNTSYLKLCSRRANLASLKSQKCADESMTNAGIFSLNEKNLLMAMVFGVSVMHTKSLRLLHILRWRQLGVTPALLNDRICDIIDEKDADLEQKTELLNFLTHFLDAIFQIGADNQFQKQYGLTLFNALVYVIRLCDEPKNAPYMAVLLGYVERFCSTFAFDFLLKNLIWYVETGSVKYNQTHNNFSHDRLLPVFKSLGVLIQVIVASKRCYDSVNLILFKGDNTRQSNNLSAQIHTFLDAFSQIMRHQSTAVMTHQNTALKYLPMVLEPLLCSEILAPTRAATYIIDLIDDFSPHIVVRQRLAFYAEIIDSELLFAGNVECRRLLLPKLLDELLTFLPPFSSPRSTNSQSSGGTMKAGTFATDSLETIEMVTRIMVDLVEKLFPYSASNCVFQRGTADELKLILFRILRPVNQTMITLLGDPLHQRTVYMLLLAVLDKFSARNFLGYFNEMRTNVDRLDMLSEMLHMFRDLLLRCPLPAEWYQMRHVQHKLFVKHLRFAYAIIVHRLPEWRDSYDDAKRRQPSQSAVQLLEFIPSIWLECMLTCVAIVKSLMNSLDTSRCAYVDVYETSNREMCKVASDTLRSLWFSLNAEHKLQLLPHVLGAVLEVALYEDETLHETTIPIFYDMFETERFVADRLQRCRNSFGLSFSGVTSEVAVLKGNNPYVNIGSNCDLDGPIISAEFGCCEESLIYGADRRSFVDEFITQLDPLLDNNRGGPMFRQKFRELFLRQSGISFSQTRFDNEDLTLLSTQDIGEKGAQLIAFVGKIDKLLELLLNYRQVRLNADCIENGMFCTVQLIDFYQRIGQHALYVSYLYKLYDLHIISENCVEAALTLKKHSNLLRWSDERLERYLVAKPSHRRFDTHLKLKENIYLEMADLFDRDEHWELAVEVLRELIPVYENVLFDFEELAKLMARLSELYMKITSKIRMENNYFLVAFYGRDAPVYLAGRRFVFRSEKLEQWGSFKQRMLHNYYGFKFIESMDDVGAQLADAEGKYIQIFPVTPQPSTTFMFLSRSSNRLSRWYYKHHRIQRFEHMRREMRADTKWTQLDANDATRLWLRCRHIAIEKPLPDILKFAPVISETEPDAINPVEVAALKIQEINETLADTAQLVAAGFIQFLVNLGGSIRGVLQADVGGGIKNYETFFTDECWQNCTEKERRSIETLKNLLCEHVMILEYALCVHASKYPQINEIFHNSLVETFVVYRRNIESRFCDNGRVKSILPHGASIHLTTITSLVSSLSVVNTANNNSATTLIPPPDLANGNHHSLLHHNQQQTSSTSLADQSQPLNQSSTGGSSSSLSTSLQHLVAPPSPSHTNGSSSSNVLFRHVPSAAHLLKSAVAGRSRSTTQNNITTVDVKGSTSGSNTGTLTKKQSLKLLGRMKSSGGADKADNSPVIPPTNEQQLQREQNLAMISALHEASNATARFSTNSLEMYGGGGSCGGINVGASPAPRLPQRTSNVHSA